MRRIVTAILGGGQGTRLWPLTRERAKPAVPVGGKFRLIDIPISNSLHAGIDQIFVITQFNSASLHRHIAQTYRFDPFSAAASSTCWRPSRPSTAASGTRAPPTPCARPSPACSSPTRRRC